jgi:transposase-like protein
MQQKALSLMQFQKKFSTEKACQKHLFRLRWPQGFRCPRCQHGAAYFHRTRHLYHCKACGYQASLTAGTVFHKTLGARLRQQREVRDLVLGCPGRYREVADNLRVKEVWVKGRRYVVCHNPQEAAKDAADREAIVQALADQLRQGAKGLVGNLPY